MRTAVLFAAVVLLTVANVPGTEAEAEAKRKDGTTLSPLTAGNKPSKNCKQKATKKPRRGTKKPQGQPRSGLTPAPVLAPDELPSAELSDEDIRANLATRGKNLALATNSLSELYAKTTDKFGDFVTATDDFLLDGKGPEIERINGGLLGARFRLLTDVQNILKTFIVYLSDISMTAVTDPQHDDLEEAVRLLASHSERTFTTLVETSWQVVKDLSESTMLEPAEQARIATVIINLTTSKVNSYAQLLEQLSQAVRDAQKNQRSIKPILDGIRKLDVLEMRIRSDLLLDALRAEYGLDDGELNSSDAAAVNRSDSKKEVDSWMSYLHISGYRQA